MTAIAKGMFPKVPQLFKGKGVTDDPVGETFWKVAKRHPAHRHARVQGLA